MNNRAHNWVESLVEKNKQRFLSLLQNLVRIPSVNPPGDTTAIFQYVTNLLEEMGVEFQTYLPRKNNPSLIAEFGSGKSPKLVINGHLDTFPIVDLSAWDNDPFSGDVHDGKIFGRGVGDMKAGVAAAIATSLLLFEERVEIEGTVILNLVSDEETGSEWGAWWLLENVPSLIGDACIIGEPLGITSPEIGQKAPLWVKITTYSNPRHGSYNDGTDAVWQMSKSICAVQYLNELIYPTPKELVEIVDALKAKAQKKLTGTDWWYESPSVNFGKIQGGVKINVVPSSCELELDLRVPFGTTSGELLEQLKKCLKNAGVKAEVEVIMGEKDSPNFTPWDSPFVKTVRNAIHAVTGITPTPSLSTGFTDGRVFRKFGIDTVSCGPTDNNMGAPNEFVMLEEFYQMIKIFCLTAIDYCKVTIGY